MFKPNQLNAFVTVAAQQSIRGAARVLGHSQPAVTKIVRELERDLGAALVERTVKGVHLTPYGQAFLPRARLLLEDMRRAREEIAQIRDGARGRISVAVSTAFALTLLPAAFSAFHDRHPLVDVIFTETALPWMLAGLNDGTLDFAVAHGWSGAISPDYDVTELYPIRAAVGVRKRHPLRRAKSLTELHAAEWIVPGDGSAALGTVAPMFSALGLAPPARVIQGQSANVAMGLVANMDLVGLFVEPLLQWASAHYGIVQINTAETLPNSFVHIVKRKNYPLTPAALQFVDCIRAAAASPSARSR